MATTVRMKRKREPLIRPVCPVHGTAMVVYASGERVRYHRCYLWPACSETKKTRRDG